MTDCVVVSKISERRREAMCEDICVSISVKSFKLSGKLNDGRNKEAKKMCEKICVEISLKIVKEVWEAK